MLLAVTLTVSARGCLRLRLRLRLRVRGTCWGVSVVEMPVALGCLGLVVLLDLSRRVAVCSFGK